MSKKLVLLSGGIDSTTCLAMARNISPAEDVVALSIYYGQKHEKELHCARKIASYYGVKFYEQNIQELMKFSECPLLSKSNKQIEHGTYATQKQQDNGIVSTYVPFRNGLFLSAAASLALQLGCEEVWYGAHADDAAGGAYPDCTPDFVNAMRNAIEEGTGKQVTLCAPLVFFHKSDVVLCGSELMAPYQFTWSCYEGGEKPCGKCATCLDRAKAFADNELTDPALEEI